jgi:hypothetical protein
VFYTSHFDDTALPREIDIVNSDLAMVIHTLYQCSHAEVGEGRFYLYFARR